MQVGKLSQRLQMSPSATAVLLPTFLCGCLDDLCMRLGAIKGCKAYLNKGMVAHVGCVADKATLIALLDFPPHAAAFMRLVWDLHSRQAPGIAVTCVTPLELFELKQIVALTPGGKVQVPTCRSMHALSTVCMTAVACIALLANVGGEHHPKGGVCGELACVMPAQIMPLPEHIEEGFYSHSLAQDGLSSSGSHRETAAADEQLLRDRPEGSTDSSASGPLRQGGGPKQAGAGSQGIRFEAGQDTLESLQELLAQRRRELGSAGSFSGWQWAEGASQSSPAAPSTTAAAPGSAPDTAQTVDGATAMSCEAKQAQVPNGHVAPELPRQGSTAGALSPVAEGQMEEEDDAPPPPPPGNPPTPAPRRGANRARSQGSTPGHSCL